MKRTSLAVLLLAVLLALTACGEKEDAAPKVYAAEALSFTMGGGQVAEGCRMGDDFYLLSAGGDIYRLPLTGGEAEKLDFQHSPLPEDAFAEDTTIRDLRPGGDGTLWLRESWSSLSEGATTLFRQLDAGGRELRRLDGGKVAQALGTNADRLDTPFSDGTGDVFVCTDTQAAVLDGDGNVRFTLDGGHGALLAGLALLGDGTVGAYVYDGSNAETPYTLRRVDKEAEGLGETYCSLSQPYGFLPGGEDVLTYYLSGDGLYRCREGAPAGELVLNWMDSGLNALDAAAVAEQEDGSLTALLVGGGAARLLSLTPTDAAASEGKTTLTFATRWLSSAMRTAILEFNQTSEDYFISVQNYGPATTLAELDAAFSRISAEILAGRSPDIFDAGCFPDLSQAAGKGLLEDLWPYLEKDPDLGRERVMERVLDAASINGGLYYLPSTFRISTVVGPRRVVGDRLGWTAEEMLAAWETMPEDSRMLSDKSGLEISKTAMLERRLFLDLDRFVDWSRGTCSFDCEEFKDLLVFANLFSDEPETGPDEYIECPSRALAGRQMLISGSIGTLEDLQFYQTCFGEDFSFVGYPSIDGSVGSRFIDNAGGPSISSTCKDKEGAWSFLRTVLLPKYEGRAITGEYDTYAEYDSPYSHRLPVNKADFEWLAEYRLKKTEESSVSLGGELDLTYVPFTQELYDQFMELYNSIDRSTTWSEDIRDIVAEAAGGYFAGDKSLDDTAREVQSRVSLYVNEQK